MKDAKQKQTNEEFLTQNEALRVYERQKNQRENLQYTSPKDRRWERGIKTEVRVKILAYSKNPNAFWAKIFIL